MSKLIPATQAIEYANDYNNKFSTNALLEVISNMIEAISKRGGYKLELWYKDNYVTAIDQIDYEYMKRIIGNGVIWEELIKAGYYVEITEPQHNGYSNTLTIEWNEK